MPNKEWALAYARLGWAVFPVSGYKIPFKGSHGHLDATTDPAQIESWWTAKPRANLAVALGDIVVVDADGPTALARLKAIAVAHGGLPRTAVARTARGLHFYFRAPEGMPIRTRNEPRAKSGDDGIDIKAHGGWTVLPPSVNAKNGFVYKWVSPLPLSELPTWLINALVPNDYKDSNRLEPLSDHLGPVPPYLSGQTSSHSNNLGLDLKTKYSSQEHGRLVDALKAIPSNNYDIWFQVGMALKTLEWERSDGTSIGFEIWDAWSQTCSEKYSISACETKWNTFGRRAGITLGTVYHLAREHGWNAGAPATGQASPPAGESGGLNGHAVGPVALPAAFLGAPIHFPDVTEDGKIRATMTNAKVAILALGLVCRFDQFHNRYIIAGEIISRWYSNELSDPVILIVRDRIRIKWGFDPGTQPVRDAAEALCLDHRFDPVLDYLDSISWDGRPRLGIWLSTYLGAPVTDLNREIGKLTLIAAVRRVRSPGTKFDQIIVLEGPQGAGKSEAIRILAGAENFSDQKILGVDDRKQQELTEGVWLYEIAELTGLKRAEIEHVKAFVSRTVDRARPAYGRYMVAQPRRTVFFGSTNQDIYLQDETGNRRFWPVNTGRIDLVGLARDRDQLWAEAAALEARGEPHLLPERLWKVADEMQGERTEVDEWRVPIENYITARKIMNTSVFEVLTDNQFMRMEASSIGQREQNRAARILRSLGFTRYRETSADGRRPWRYRKIVDAR